MRAVETPMYSSLPSPSPSAIEHSARVADRVAEEIEGAGGWIPFDRYMQIVLYEPQLGYYAAGARKFGDAAAGGDFVTAPEISPLFAQALAEQCAQLFGWMPARLLEFGAGSGVLASDLIAALSKRNVALDSYSIVEVSTDLADRQRGRLQGTSVEWLTAPPPRFEGVMLANEVLDVMPCKMFLKHRGEIFERGVVRDQHSRSTRFAFAERAPDVDLATAVASIEHALGALPDGYGSEVSLIAQSWMRSAAEWLARGALLVFDYGFPSREYYHRQRIMGTLMCHFRHRAHSDSLWMPGLNDITAHVDFSAIAEAAHGAGFDVLGYTSQAHFLLNCGVLCGLQADYSPQRTAALHRLVSEAEMGELVKVLCVGRGVEGALVGFARGDRLHSL
ncbi:MAG: SAM-dependent methyltransferase [Burkholderiaceae bacterium]